MVLNKKCIVRCDRSGVVYGEVVSVNGSTVELRNARKIYYWQGAMTLFQLATEGTQEPEGCQFTVIVESVLVLDAIEIIPCTAAAIESIEGVEVWKV